MAKSGINNDSHSGRVPSTDVGEEASKKDAVRVPDPQQTVSKESVSCMYVRTVGSRLRLPYQRISRPVPRSNLGGTLFKMLT